MDIIYCRQAQMEAYIENLMSALYEPDGNNLIQTYCIS